MNNRQIPQDIELTSACYARSPVSGEHTLLELPLCGKLNIRADSSQPKLVEAIGKALSVMPPVIPNTKATNDSVAVFWMGPDEWLAHCPLDQTRAVTDEITNQLGQSHHAVVDVSDYYTVIRLSGSQSESVIRRGCPLDLHTNVFPAGSIAQTRFGHSSILLERHADGTTWDIQVRWTYAEYVWDYLDSAIAAL